MHLKLAVVSSALTLFAANAGAAPVTFTFTYTGVGSGTLGGEPFAEAEFVITATGDTDSRTSFENGHQIDHLSSSIEVEGFPVLTVLTGTHTFVNNEGQIAGYTRNPAGDLYYSPADPVFEAWDMLSSIGPISGEAELLQWGDEFFGILQTSGGSLVFEDALTIGSFQATVPEPGSESLSAMAILAMAIVGSRARFVTRRALGSRGAGRRDRSRR